jgi:hypothetical protein
MKSKEFVSYPKIGQFRQVVKGVRERSAYEGRDENDDPILNYDNPQPTITFTGTVKLHGTNAGVGYDPITKEVYAQSRSQVLSVEKDNAGFAFFVERNKDELATICKEYLDGTDSLVTVFGEWCGGNIQKGVAITGLPKMFVIFAVKVGEDWVKVIEDKSWTFSNIHQIYDFQTYTIDIDFNNPDLSVPKLQQLTQEVEDECPVGRDFGVSGIGEGIVWSDQSGNYFKVKGEKHSSSKVKKLANVDVDKINSINEFTEYAVTENRLRQGIDFVFTMNGLEPDIKFLGDYIRWVMKDVLTEEIDTLAANALEPKDVGKSISYAVRVWFKSEYI